MRVELLRYTPSPEELVAMGAKLCYAAADLDTLKQRIDAKDQSAFLDNLTAMGHLSVMEHAAFTFGVEGVSRALLAQLTRHRIASFSVQSQRYVRPGAKGFDYIVPPAIEELGEDAVREFSDQMAQMQKWYDGWQEKLGANGESTNEDARFVLPNAASTRLIVTMNARELLHFFSLRCCNRAQWEIRSMAWEMLRQATQAAPHLFKNAGPGCLRGACPEGAKCCGKMAQVREKREELR
jgi:thymidylate synthase (FAD)